MGTKLLMTVAAIATAGAGLVLLFLPQEVVGLAGGPPASTPALAMQLMGALYLGVAMTNWMARDSLLGGIYGRPVLIGNVTHFVIGALALLKGASAHPQAATWIAAAVYAVLAVLFSVTMVRGPARVGPP
jgi:hypothetical protein